MNVRNLSSLLLSLLTLVVLGCGGGGGDGSPTPVSTVSGEASKGPIIGGDVKLFAINADGTLQTTPLTTTPATVTTRAPFGNYSAVINYEGPVKVVVTGGKYEDEATKLQLDNISLSAVVANVSGSAKVSVTPFTEMAAQKAEKAENKFTPANIKAANTAVSIALGLVDDKGIRVDIVEAKPSTNPAYKSKLAVFSQAVLTQAKTSHASDSTSADVTKLMTDMASSIDDTGEIANQNLKIEFEKASEDAFKNPNINEPGKDPVVEGSAVSRVTITASPSTNVAITTPATPVIISATVTTVSGGHVPNDTVVTFTASAGSLTDVTKTKDGVATATLSGITVPQTVSIKASAGVASSSEININFVNPASPDVITVKDIPGVHFISTPVTVTTTVVNKAGGAVKNTPVIFEITSGNGALSQAGSTTDENGNATVTLTSAVDGIVTVKVTVADPATGILTTGSHTITFTDPNKPKSIILTTNRTSGVTNNQGPVILTAALTPQNIETGTIADGTPVTFTISSGTGGTLSPTTATTIGGVATVTLNSTAAGSIIVNATAGSAPLVTSNDVIVPFISQPTQVTVKVRTIGALPAGTTIGGLKATVTANPSSGLSIVQPPEGATNNTTDIHTSGAGVGSTLVVNANNVAAVTLALVNTNGIQTGEFATLNYNVKAGSFPTASDFSIALNGSVIDTLSANLTGIGVEILSVTIQ